MFLSLIIPGPDYPGKQLGVFMQPLVDALHHSWYFPRLTYNRDLQRNFLMKVWLHYCMHDFPGYALYILRMVYKWEDAMPSVHAGSVNDLAE